MGVMPSQAKKHLALPGAGRDEKGFSPRVFGGSVALLRKLMEPRQKQASDQAVPRALPWTPF